MLEKSMCCLLSDNMTILHAGRLTGSMHSQYTQLEGSQYTMIASEVFLKQDGLLGSVLLGGLSPLLKVFLFLKSWRFLHGLQVSVS